MHDLAIKNALKTMKVSNKFHGVYVYGSTSTGKTYEIIKNLTKLGLIKDTIIINAHTTPLALFIKMQQNPNKIIFLDDLDGMNDIVVSILKGALWEIDGKREVSWLSTSTMLYNLDLKQKFIFKGKLIIATNSVKQYKKFEPVIARMFSIEQELDLEKVKILVSVLLKQYRLGNKVEQFINSFVHIYITPLNLRTILKWCEFTKNKFEQDANDLFKVDEELKDLFDGMNRIKFCDKHCCSKRTYQRKKKRFKELS